MKKKILLTATSLLLIFLFFIANQNKKSVALAQAAAISCQTVTGGCIGGTNTKWYSLNAPDARCSQTYNIAAVQCPIVGGVQWHVIGGGCRQDNNAHISDECPTSLPDSGNADESKYCQDYTSTYSWWFCNFDATATWETAYAICCTGV